MLDAPKLRLITLSENTAKWLWLWGEWGLSILVEADEYLLELLRYIHKNPLRAGLSKDLNDYEWSSHNGYLSKAKR